MGGGPQRCREVEVLHVSPAADACLISSAVPSAVSFGCHYAGGKLDYDMFGLCAQTVSH